MNVSSLAEIKRELGLLDGEKLLELCMRLAKYKKDNKELLTYLLFESGDEHAYVDELKEEMDEQFRDLPAGNIYFQKKALRRILRMTNKQIRFSGSPQTEIECRIHFCTLLKNSGVRLDKSQVLLNLYQQQLKKVNSALKRLPEDLQLDYQRALDELL